MDKEIRQLVKLWPKIPQWAKERIIKVATISTEREEWRDIVIPKNAGKGLKAMKGKFQVSSLGRIRYKKSKKVIQLYQSCLYNLPVHPIIARTFHGLKPSPEYGVRHLDGDSQNNCAKNLKWGTAKDQAVDKKKHKMIKRKAGE